MQPMDGNNGTMTIAFWICASLLAFVYLFAGVMKVIRSKAALLAAGQGWAETAPVAAVKAIGLVEVLGAIGLIAPGLVAGAPTILVPLAAVGFILVQAVAIGVHMRRGEARVLPVNIILLALAIAVAFLGAAVFQQ